MLALDELVEAIDSLKESELRRWIELRWVRPDRHGPRYYFDDIDCARVRFICDLRHDLSIDDETVPVVLSLVDQLYEVRHALRRLGAAVEAQPETVRQQILARLTDRDRGRS